MQQSLEQFQARHCHPEIGFFRIAPTVTIGIFAGIAFMRSGLAAAILLHFLANLVGLFADHHTFIADGVIFGSAAVTLVVLPLTLWFTRKRRRSWFALTG